MPVYAFAKRDRAGRRHHFLCHFRIDQCRTAEHWLGVWAARDTPFDWEDATKASKKVRLMCGAMLPAEIKAMDRECEGR